MTVSKESKENFLTKINSSPRAQGLFGIAAVAIPSYLLTGEILNSASLDPSFLHGVEKVLDGVGYAALYRAIFNRSNVGKEAFASYGIVSLWSWPQKIIGINPLIEPWDLIPLGIGAGLWGVIGTAATALYRLRNPHKNP